MSNQTEAPKYWDITNADECRELLENLRINHKPITGLKTAEGTDIPLAEATNYQVVSFMEYFYTVCLASGKVLKRHDGKVRFLFGV